MCLTKLFLSISQVRSKTEEAILVSKIGVDFNGISRSTLIRLAVPITSNLCVHTNNRHLLRPLFLTDRVDWINDPVGNRWSSVTRDMKEISSSQDSSSILYIRCFFVTLTESVKNLVFLEIAEIL